MFKYTVICTLAVSCIGFASPMGLGQNYTNKPAFFHKDFYSHNKNHQTISETNPNIVAQKDSIIDQRRSS